jgi:hypothetical protein
MNVCNPCSRWCSTSAIHCAVNGSVDHPWVERTGALLLEITGRMLCIPVSTHMQTLTVYIVLWHRQIYERCVKIM